MTHVLPSLKLKSVTDSETNERIWIFFRQSLADPFLVLYDYEMQDLVRRVAAEQIETTPRNP